MYETITKQEILHILRHTAEGKKAFREIIKMKQDIIDGMTQHIEKIEKRLNR